MLSWVCWIGFPFLLASFALGAWWAWMRRNGFWSSKIETHKSQYDKSQYATLKSEHDGYLTKYNSLSSDYSVADKERVTYKREAGDWRLKYNNQSAEIADWKTKYDGMNTSYLGFKSDATKREADWKLKWESSKKELDKSNADWNLKWEKEKVSSDWNLKFANFEKENKDAVDGKDKLILDWTNKYNALQKQLKDKEEEKTALDTDWNLKWTNLNSDWNTK